MTFTHPEIEGLVLIELEILGDERGFFVERYHERRFEEAGLPTRFCQDNHSRSSPGVLRGLHFQYDSPQGKLVGCTRGRIWDVAVDIRPDSKTYGRHYCIELSDMNGRVLWIPPGFAHGFCVLGQEPADLLYKVTAPYNPGGEAGISWADPELQIPWPIERAIVSQRDQNLKSFAEYKARPVEWKTAP